MIEFMKHVLPILVIPLIKGSTFFLADKEASDYTI